MISKLQGQGSSSPSTPIHHHHQQHISPRVLKQYNTDSAAQAVVCAR